MLDEKTKKAIQNFDLESYVRATFDKVVEAGNQELRVDCFSPNGCAGSDTKAHLWINPSKKVWNCFKCGYGNTTVQRGSAFLPRFIADAEHIPLHQAMQKVSKSTEITPDFGDLDNFEIMLEQIFDEEEPEEPEIRHIRLPKQFHELAYSSGTTSTNFRNYANKRGFTEELQELYDVRYCVSDIPTLPDKYKRAFSKRIVFPIYDQEGVCRSAVARDIGNSQKRTKWVNWPETDLAHFFWPLGRVIDTRYHPYSMGLGRVVLTEGIMDAHAVRQLTRFISFACFGKKLSDAQIELLQKNRVREIILAWDRDAKRQTVRAVERLMGRFKLKVLSYNSEIWEKFDLDLGDTLNPKCPISADMLEEEVKSAIDVESPEYCRWVMV
jgi:hypothetical protein